MEHLVFLMWIADVIEHLNAAAGIIAIIALVAVVISGIFWFFCTADGNDKDDFEIKVSSKVFKISMICLLIFGFFCMVIPSKKVTYSYIGVKSVEKILDTETGKMITDEGKQMIQDVGEIIHSYAADLKKKD